MESKTPSIENQSTIPHTFSATAELDSYLPAKQDSKEHETTPYPHVTLTYAQSLDGQISLQPGARTVLSGPETKAMTHYLRSRHDGILVGIGTAKADNPGLNTRYTEDGRNAVGFARQPRPFVLDPSGRWSLGDTPKLFSLAESKQGKPPSWIVGRGDVDESLEKKVLGSDGVVLDAGDYSGREDGVDWDTILKNMKSKGVRSVMIEGGGAVIKDLLRKKNQKYINSVIVTIAPTCLGAGGVDVSPRRSVDTENEVNLKDVRWIPLGQDVVMAGVIK